MFSSFLRSFRRFGTIKFWQNFSNAPQFFPLQLFLKDMPNLHKMMKRLHKNQKKPHLNSSLEPDFYRMPHIEPSAAAAVQRRNVGHDNVSNEHQNQEHQLQQQRQQEGLDTVASQIQSLQALQQNLNAGQVNSSSSSQSIGSSNNTGGLLAALGLAGNRNIFSQPSSLYQQQQQQNQQPQPQQQGLESTQSSALLSNSEAQRLLSLVSSQALQQQVLMNALRDRQQEQLIQQLIQNHLSQSRSNLFASLNQQQNASRENTSSNLLSSLLNSGQGNTSQLFSNNSGASSLLDQIRASDVLLQQQRLNSSAGTVPGNNSNNCTNLGTQQNSSDYYMENTQNT